MGEAMTDKRLDEIERRLGFNDVPRSVARELAAEVRRLRAERDALLRWTTHYSGHLGRFFQSGHWDAYGDAGWVQGATAEEAVRRAAGLGGGDAATGNERKGVDGG